MSEEKIVVYQTFSDPINAYIVKGLLESYDIQCFLSDENIVSVNALYAQAVGGVKLNVFEKDIRLIDSIMASSGTKLDTVTEENSERGIICPNCLSTNVAYGGSVKRKFGLMNIIISIFLMIYPFYMRKAYHCFDCDHEFKKA